MKKCIIFILALAIFFVFTTPKAQAASNFVGLKIKIVDTSGVALNNIRVDMINPSPSSSTWVSATYGTKKCDSDLADARPFVNLNGSGYTFWQEVRGIKTGEKRTYSGETYDNSDGEVYFGNGVNSTNGGGGMGFGFACSCEPLRFGFYIPDGYYWDENKNGVMDSGEIKGGANDSVVKWLDIIDAANDTLYSYTYKFGTVPPATTTTAAATTTTKAATTTTKAATTTTKATTTTVPPAGDPGCNFDPNPVIINSDSDEIKGKYTTYNATKAVWFWQDWNGPSLTLGSDVSYNLGAKGAGSYELDVFNGTKTGSCLLRVQKPATTTTAAVTTTASTTTTIPISYGINVRKTQTADLVADRTWTYRVDRRVNGIWTNNVANGSILVASPGTSSSTNIPLSQSGTYRVVENPGSFPTGWSVSTQVTGGNSTLTQTSANIVLTDIASTGEVTFTNTKAQAHKITVKVKKDDGTYIDTVSANVSYYQINGVAGTTTYPDGNAGTVFSLPNSGTSSAQIVQRFRFPETLTISGAQWVLKPDVDHRWYIENGSIRTPLATDLSSEVRVESRDGGNTVIAGIYSPPLPTFSCSLGTFSKTVVNVGEEITITDPGYSVTPAGYVARWELDWGDGTAKTTYDSPGGPAELKHTYSSEGEFYVKINLLSIKDLTGAWIDKATALARGYVLVECPSVGQLIKVKLKSDDSGNETI